MKRSQSESGVEVPRIQGGEHLIEAEDRRLMGESGLKGEQGGEASRGEESLRSRREGKDLRRGRGEVPAVKAGGLVSSPTTLVFCDLRRDGAWAEARPSP